MPHNLRSTKTRPTFLRQPILTNSSRRGKSPQPIFEEFLCHHGRTFQRQGGLSLIILLIPLLITLDHLDGISQIIRKARVDEMSLLGKYVRPMKGQLISYDGIGSCPFLWRFSPTTLFVLKVKKLRLMKVMSTLNNLCEIQQIPRRGAGRNKSYCLKRSAVAHSC